MEYFLELGRVELFDGYRGSLSFPGGCFAVENRITPLAIFRVGPVHNIEVNISQPTRKFTHLSRADPSVIRARYGTDLYTCPAQERFIRKIEFGTVDRTFLDFHLQF